jgi:hypothetical protein
MPVLHIFHVNSLTTKRTQNICQYSVQTYKYWNTSKCTIADRTKIARDCTIAMAFLRGADPRRYSTLWADLANQQTRGNDQYPKDLTAAYSMLVNFHAPVPARSHQNTTPVTNVTTTTPTDAVSIPVSVSPHTFVQGSGASSSTPASVAGNDGVTHNTVTCFNCTAIGHYTCHCPSAITLLQHADTRRIVKLLIADSRSDTLNPVTNNRIHLRYALL